MLRTILVPLDGSPLGEYALPTATDLAHRSRAQLLLVRAARHDTDEAAAYLDQLPAEAFGLPTDPMAEDLPASSRLPPCLRLVIPGDPAEAILAAARDNAADLIVMTTHGRGGLRHLLLGSVAEKVIAASPLPVWVVRASHPSLPSVVDIPVEILVPLDGSPFAEAALPVARQLASVLHAGILLVHAIEPTSLADDLLLTQPIIPPETALLDASEARTYLGDWVERLRLEGRPARLIVADGTARDVLLRESAAPGIRLVVIATHGRTGLRQTLFGSVAHDVLRHGTLPVVLVRPSPLHP
ncbi:MAG: universal stress protein [Anaerolineae bacterium]|nr:universal stress protein [Anaerolineae bacterium]